jgi:hypothetical protein
VTSPTPPPKRAGAGAADPAKAMQKIGEAVVEAVTTGGSAH